MCYHVSSSDPSANGGVPMGYPVHDPDPVTRTLVYLVDRGPYFVVVGMAQPHVNNLERLVTLLGALLHIGLWTSIFALDTDLYVHDFSATHEQTLYFLHLISWITVLFAACGVLLSLCLHYASQMFDLNFSFNDGHMPAFLSTLILGSSRATLEFSKFELFYFFFVVEPAGVLAVSTYARNVLVAQVVFKQIAVTFTVNAHRFAVRKSEAKTAMVAAWA